MKPILPISLAICLVALSSSALADYSGTQILNQAQIYSGNVNVSDSVGAVGPGNDAGVVQVDANGINTTIQGNISITNTNATAAANAHGVFLKTGTGIVSQININNTSSDVNVSTQGASNGSGVFHSGGSASNASKLTVDAGNYNLNVNKVGTATGAGFGVLANAGGHVDINAKNVNVDYSSSATSYGVYADGDNSTLNIVTQGKVTAKGGNRGAAAYDGGVLNITGDLDASATRVSDGIGVYAGGNGKAQTALTVSGHTTISGQAQYGAVASNKGTLTLQKGLTVNQSALGATAAVYASGGTVKDGIANGATGTKYNVSGQMRAATNAGTVGTIDLHMGAGSTFSGYTSKGAATDVINIELSNGANWTTTTANSNMSSLSVFNGGSIAFGSNDGGATFLNINAAALSIEQGTLLKLNVASTDLAINQIVTLFTGTLTGFTANNAYLTTADGKAIQYTTEGLALGQYKILEVPEPTTASLSLLGLAAMMIRRRRA